MSKQAHDDIAAGLNDAIKFEQMRAERDRLREALRDIAWQKIGNEMEDDDMRGLDWKEAYEACVQKARAGGEHE